LPDSNQAADSYYSVSTGVSADLECAWKCKRSVFLGSVVHVTTSEEVRAFLRTRTDLHKRANHHCWAYRIHPPELSLQEFSSDAGEPAGSAGKPILGVLRSLDLRNLVVVVSRYFGGIQLGIRGLIDAYSHCTRKTLENVGITLFSRGKELELDMDYATWNRVEVLLKKNALPVLPDSLRFSDRVQVAFLVDRERWHEVEELLQPFLRTANGQIRWKEPERWIQRNAMDFFQEQGGA